MRTVAAGKQPQSLFIFGEPRYDQEFRINSFEAWPLKTTMMIRRLSILCVVVLCILTLSCKEGGGKSSATESTSGKALAVPPDNGNDRQQVILTGAKVLSANKKITADTTEAVMQRCKSWYVASEKIQSMLEQFKPMSSEEQYLSFPYYPCEIVGKLSVNDSLYDYWLGAGGTLTIQKGDKSLYYGYTGPHPEDYFLSGKLSDKDLYQ